MKHVMMRTTVVAVGMAAVLAACATTSKMSSSEAIAARQKLMKEQGAAMKSIQDKAKAGQAQTIGPEAQKLVETSKQIPALFPEGSLDPNTSRAKSEIWQKRSEFEGYAKTLNSKATQLVATAQGGNAEATNAAVADLGKTTCGACHNTFRGPELKK
jgi:cytochrome c556